MKVVIKTKNVKLNRALKDFIEEKINDLEKFSKAFQSKKYFNSYYGKGKPRAEAWVEIGKTTLHHRKGPFLRVECQMRILGRSLRAAARSKDLRLAMTEVKDRLQRQLKQYKNRFIAKTKRRQRKLKRSLRLAPSAKIKRKKGARIREEGI